MPASLPSLRSVGSFLALSFLSCLMFWRGARVKPVLQFALYMGMAIWIQTMMEPTRLRQVFGHPWLPMAMILSGAVLATARI